jgi:hypothetical protein
VRPRRISSGQKTGSRYSKRFSPQDGVPERHPSTQSSVNLRADQLNFWRVGNWDNKYGSSDKKCPASKTLASILIWT